MKQTTRRSLEWFVPLSRKRILNMISFSLVILISSQVGMGLLWGPVCDCWYQGLCVGAV